MSDTQLLGDLLAVIHGDGGHHTEKVGIEQSAKDAREVFWQLTRELDEARARLEWFEESGGIAAHTKIHQVLYELEQQKQEALAARAHFRRACELLEKQPRQAQRLWPKKAAGEWQAEIEKELEAKP